MGTEVGGDRVVKIGGVRLAMDGRGGADVTKRVAAVIDSGDALRRAIYRHMATEGRSLICLIDAYG